LRVPWPMETIFHWYKDFHKKLEKAILTLGFFRMQWGSQKLFLGTLWEFLDCPTKCGVTLRSSKKISWNPLADLCRKNHSTLTSCKEFNCDVRVEQNVTSVKKLRQKKEDSVLITILTCLLIVTICATNSAGKFTKFYQCWNYKM